MDCDYVLDTQNQLLLHTICYLYASMITIDLVTDEGGTKGDWLRYIENLSYIYLIRWDTEVEQFNNPKKIQLINPRGMKQNKN